LDLLRFIIFKIRIGSVQKHSLLGVDSVLDIVLGKIE